MPQNSAEKKEKRSRDAINPPARADRVSPFQLGGNLSNAAANREMSVIDKRHTPNPPSSDGTVASYRGEQKGFNPQEEANRLEMEKNMERQKIGGEGQEAGRDAINLPAQAGQPAQAGIEEGGDGGGEGAEKENEKMTVPSEISAFVLQWEFIFALAGPFFLFILLVEFIALRVFSMFKFSKWKKICTLGNFFLACLTSLIYFLFFMMLMAAIQETGGTATGVLWWGIKTTIKGIASSAWGGLTSFFGFGR